MTSSFAAIVSWPNAPLTERLVRNALRSINVDILDEHTAEGRLLQWSTYDSIDHEAILTRRSDVLASSYIFRKALIRKHFLSRIIHSYCVKNPTSLLTRASPETFELELSFADELDEMWTDELWELGDRLDNTDDWWILKPGMADRGMGIRLFHSKDSLQQIFEEFEEEEEDENPGDTTVVMSQLRHFVIQQYLLNPVLFDPREASREVEVGKKGHKFHLRVYCVASGALKVYVYDRILALFAAVPYGPPTFEIMSEDEPPVINLTPHLTNTSLQTERGEENVRLLDELVGCKILSGDGAHGVLSQDDHKALIAQIGDVLGETFRAGLEASVHFQPIPNAFELYGVDFLVVHSQDSSSPFQVKLLEINAEPAIELTGPRLTWILEDLFKSVADVCVRPFFEESGEEWPVGETRNHLLKCLDAAVRSWD